MGSTKNRRKWDGKEKNTVRKRSKKRKRRKNEEIKRVTETEAQT
jgi:hypothetical protein